MKITEVRAHVLEAQLSQPFSYSRLWYSKRMSMIVEVMTDEGLVGWGECYGPARINAAVVRELGLFLVGQDPLRSEYLWHELYARYRDHGMKGVVIQGLSGIDIALWDIKGKAFGQPVHRLMGGPTRSRVKAYATGLYRRETGDPETYLCAEAAESCVLGFKAMKLKVGFGVAEDAQITHAIRRTIGPDIGLMVDANHAYDSVAAISLGRRIEHLDIGWFEEPVPPEDLDGHVAVRQALTIPVATGECEFTRHGFRTLMDRRAADIVQPDLCAAGGLSECKKIADMTMAYGVRFAPHVWGTGIAIAAATQLLAVTADYTPPSLRPIEPMLEFDRTEHPVRAALLVEPIAPVDGYVTVPTGPGLGIEINRDVLLRFAAA